VVPQHLPRQLDARREARPGECGRGGLRGVTRYQGRFAIEIETCARCQGPLRVIASIEEPEVIAGILAHREREGGAVEPELAPIAARAPPRPRPRQGRLL
jgi:hypothetical protein